MLQSRYNATHGVSTPSPTAAKGHRGFGFLENKEACDIGDRAKQLQNAHNAHKNSVESPAKLGMLCPLKINGLSSLNFNPIIGSIILISGSVIPCADFSPLHLPATAHQSSREDRIGGGGVILTPRSTFKIFLSKGII